MRICIAYAPQDRDTALRLSELLEARGVAVSCLGIGGSGPAVGVTAIAPPPLELADRHLRDRFMMAGYALAKIRDEASHPPPA